MINIDCLAAGYGMGVRIARKHGSLFNLLKSTMERSVNRPFREALGRDEIVTRPRTDEANFFVKGVPTAAPFAFGSTVRIPYHVPGDTMDYIDFDLSHDAVRWMALTMMELGNIDKIEAKAR